MEVVDGRAGSELFSTSGALVGWLVSWGGGVARDQRKEKGERDCGR